MRTTTLVEVLQSRAGECGKKTAFTVLNDDETTEQEVTFEELDIRARAIAAQLQEMGAADARVLLLYPPGIEFVAAFLGCLYAGAVAVPSHPPQASRADRSSAVRLVSIIQDAAPAFALTTDTLAARTTALCDEVSGIGSVCCLVPRAVSEAAASRWVEPGITGDSIAFLQYTSGSTGTPKGVLVSHANVLHNLNSISAAATITHEDIGVNWLPPYHDMGLIGGLIQPVSEGTSVVLMSPVSFLHRPQRWLSTISRVRATVSGGPDFAYDLCIRRITPEQKEHLDLSSWRVAMNGAEPIRPATLKAFEEAFAPCGFSAKSWLPCYGLAEATLFVSGGFIAETPVRDLVTSGPPANGLRVEIVHPTERTVCTPGTVGEIWVQGPSVARGYWNKPALNQEIFHAHLADGNGGPFLRTGDLGFLDPEGLFVAGRLQDVIVVGDRTFHPQDIERTVEASHPALRRGASAAFGIDSDGETGVVVLCEVERHSQRNLDMGAVKEAIRQSVVQAHAVGPAAIRLLKTATVPKISSGKIQRHACRNLYLSGGIDTLEVEEKARVSAAVSDSEG